MNRNLLIRIAPPSMMFYQSNKLILYNSEKLIAKFIEDQSLHTFDLAENDNVLINTNDQMEEKNVSIETGYSEQQLDQSSEAGESNLSQKKVNLTEKNCLLKNGKRTSEQSTKRTCNDVLETIDQKICILSLANPPDVQSNGHELVRMLACMSGTILFGTNMIETKIYENITFKGKEQDEVFKKIMVIHGTLRNDAWNFSDIDLC